MTLEEQIQRELEIASLIDIVDKVLSHSIYPLINKTLRHNRAFLNIPYISLFDHFPSISVSTGNTIIFISVLIILHCFAVIYLNLSLIGQKSRSFGYTRCEYRHFIINVVKGSIGSSQQIRILWVEYILTIKKTNRIWRTLHTKETLIINHVIVSETIGSLIIEIFIQFRNRAAFENILHFINLTIIFISYNWFVTGTCINTLSIFNNIVRAIDFLLTLNTFIIGMLEYLAILDFTNFIKIMKIIRNTILYIGLIYFSGIVSFFAIETLLELVVLYILAINIQIWVLVFTLREIVDWNVSEILVLINNTVGTLQLIYKVLLTIYYELLFRVRTLSFY